jgi:hypothetical protein
MWEEREYFTGLLVEINLDHNGILRYSSSLLRTVKGTAVPLQAWTGPEGSRSLRFPDFKTVGA